MKVLLKKKKSNQIPLLLQIYIFSQQLYVSIDVFNTMLYK